MSPAQDPDWPGPVDPDAAPELARADAVWRIGCRIVTPEAGRAAHRARTP